MAKASYSEDINVQEPAAKILADELQWHSVYAFQSETFGPDSLLGRKNETEVVLVRELDKALHALNPAIPHNKLLIARDMLLDADSTKNTLQHNEEKWRLMRDGITLKSPTGNAEDDVHVRVIDFETVTNNSFIAVRELWIKHGPYTKRCDIVGFVNGLPLVFIELKRHDKGLQAAFDDNYTDYKDTIPHLFHYNALVIVSNGLDARCGSITSSWDHFYRWKRLQEEDADPAPKPDEPPIKTILPILLRGMCSKQNLLDIVENFTLFDHSEEHTVKIVARNHQMIGVNRAIAKLESGDADVLAGKLGVFWHTQGSGKSYSMVFFCQKVHRKISGSYTFVLLTDRKELDDQIYSTFVGCGISTNKKDKATGAEGLEHLLRDENRRYVFSLIHKFRNRVTEGWSQRDDIIVVSDEAHRTQYGSLATTMRMVLPKAKFIGFTGTPLIDPRERGITEKTFGTYVSVYDFQRAVADGATLPLTYENRGEKLKLVDEELNKRIEERIDAARKDGELSEEQEEKLNRELARDYPVLTSDTHLNNVADDFVEHLHERWRLMEPPSPAGLPKRYGGNAKALMVCIDKVTCVRMAQKIKERWEQKIEQLNSKLGQEYAQLEKAGKQPSAYVDRLQSQVNWMINTQIHPVFSSEQNEVKDFAAEGIDVKPYRETIVKGIDGKALDECFKDNKHPFRVAVVCAMWLTGFDVKSLATLYLDKPMKGHTLMQAIARVNRVAPNKKMGLIIDYNGMLKSLRAALADYGQSKKDDGDPVIDPFFDEQQALAEYENSITKVIGHLKEQGFELTQLTQAQDGEPKWQALLDAQKSLSQSAEIKKTFQVLADDVSDRFRALFPNQGLYAFEDDASAISAIYNLLQKPKPKVDIAAIMQELRGVVDDALELAGADKAKESSKQYDLSGIDFERLHYEFSKSPYKETAVLTLQERIQARLERMLRVNPQRVDLYQRYMDVVAEYNSDKDKAEIQRVFDELLKVHDALDEEEKRYIAMGFDNERELAVFDLLSKEKSAVTEADRKKIKEVSKQVLAMILERKYEMTSLRDRAAMQAQIKAAIIDQLLSGLPDEFSSNDIEIRADWVFRLIEQQLAEGVIH